MKNLLLTTAVTLALTTPVFAGEGHGEAKTDQTHDMAETVAEYTKGKVKKINEKTGKVTIVHGPLVKLDMPAMTMVFRAEKAMIAKMSVGQDIEFVADRVKGKLTVVELK